MTQRTPGVAITSHQPPSPRRGQEQTHRRGVCVVSLGAASSCLRGQGPQREGLEWAHSSRAQKTPGLPPHAREKPHCLAFGSDTPRLDSDQLQGLGRWPMSPTTLVACRGTPHTHKGGLQQTSQPGSPLPAPLLASSLVTTVLAFHYFIFSCNSCRHQEQACPRKGHSQCFPDLSWRGRGWPPTPLPG